MGTQRPAPFILADGTIGPGVTTVLSNVKLGGIDPLLAWAWRLGRDGKDFREERDKAATSGTCAHDMCEAFIKQIPFEPSLYPPEVLAAAQPAFDAFRRWLDDSKLVPVYSEVDLRSERLRFRGMIDVVFRRPDGSLEIGDFKTSNHIYPDHVIQIAAYQLLWNDYAAEKLSPCAHLLRITKPQRPTDPVSYHHHFWSDLSHAARAWMLCRELYDLHAIVKSLV